jgi:hypothetical protein
MGIEGSGPPESTRSRGLHTPSSQTPPQHSPPQQTEASPHWSTHLPGRGKAGLPISHISHFKGSQPRHVPVVGSSQCWHSPQHVLPQISLLAGHGHLQFWSGGTPSGQVIGHSHSHFCSFQTWGGEQLCWFGHTHCPFTHAVLGA